MATINRILLVFLALFLVGFSSHASALSAEDRASINGDSIYYWADQTGSCSGDDGGALSATLPANVPKAYNTLFTNAAQAEHANVNLLTALFLTEHGNTWPDPAGPWASSSTGASGPFQFEPGTWQAYKTDGNGDGKEDVQNLADSAYSAANLIAADGAKPATQLGAIAHPWVPKTILYIAGTYNAGGGTLQEDTKPSDPLDAPGLQGVAPITLSTGKSVPQVVNYVANVYYLITSGYTHGNPGYGGDKATVTGSGGGNSTAAATAAASAGDTGDCSSIGAVQGNIIQTAVNFAWDDIAHPRDNSDTANHHGFQQIPTSGSAPANYKYVKPSYLAAADASASASTYYTDCGMFVSSVMRSSGVDKAYPISPTGSQLNYVRNNPKYTFMPSFSNTSDLKPGDILVNDGHTYLYVGNQADGYSVAEASQGNHSPEIDNQPYPSQSDGGNFAVARIKAQ